MLQNHNETQGVETLGVETLGVETLGVETQVCAFPALEALSCYLLAERTTPSPRPPLAVSEMLREKEML